MKRLFYLFFCIFLYAEAADAPGVHEDSLLHIQSVRLAPGFYLFTLSWQKDGKELGRLQFKFYDTKRTPKISEIDYIIIVEEARNLGNGDLLLKKALDVMKELQCEEVKTGVHSDNEPSKRLLEKNGFIKEGEAVPHALGGEQIPFKKQL